MSEIWAANGFPTAIPSECDLLNLREGLRRAMPGRYSVEGARRYHAAVCGAGAPAGEIALRIARQGYFLETAVPLITLVSTDGAAAPDALGEAALAAELATERVASADIADFERQAQAVAGVPLAAVHCAGDTPGAAMAMALAWERTLLEARLPVPPVVAYGVADLRGSRSGMLRGVPIIEAAAASRLADLEDRRARTMHDSYVATQQAARGAAFGSAPAEVPWAQLPERFRDDNRSAADHVDYKLARIRCVAAEDAGAGAELLASDVDLLAAVEHARWMASKNLGGVRFGAVRDDARRLHPDMVPFAQLTEEAKAKDRSQVRTIPDLLRIAKEQLRREVSVETRPAGRSGQSGGFAVARRTADGARAIAEMQELADAGVALEIVLNDVSREILAEAGDVPHRRALAGLIESAHRISHVAGRGDAD